MCLFLHNEPHKSTFLSCTEQASRWALVKKLEMKPASAISDWKGNTSSSQRPSFSAQTRLSLTASIHCTVTRRPLSESTELSPVHARRNVGVWQGFSWCCALCLTGACLRLPLRLPIAKIRNPVAIFRGEAGGAQGFDVVGCAADIGCRFAANGEGVHADHGRSGVDVAVQG